MSYENHNEVNKSTLQKLREKYPSIDTVMQTDDTQDVREAFMKEDFFIPSEAPRLTSIGEPKRAKSQMQLLREKYPSIDTEGKVNDSDE